MNRLAWCRRWASRSRQCLSRAALGLHGWLAILVILAGSTLAATIPPLQSPDEADHVRRAYILTQGVLVLKTINGSMSGGPIDSGLAEWIRAYHALTFPDHWEDRYSVAQQQALDALHWAHKKEFIETPGTGYYFPLIYAPQALGLAAGEALDLTISQSYRLARLLTLASCVVLAFLAFRLWPASPLVFALLVLPMTVFQTVAASIDGLSTALLLLLASLFLRMLVSDTPPRRSTSSLLAVLVFAVVTCRYQLLPLVVLPGVVAWRSQKRHDWVVFLLCTVAVLAWTWLAMHFTVDRRVDVGATGGTILHYYLTQPLTFVKVVWRTITDPITGQFYWQSFLGRLSSLEVLYSQAQYRWMLAALGATALLSVAAPRNHSEAVGHVALLLCALAALPLTFLAMLISWTPHPANVVLGVQGRYFMAPALLAAYALCGHRPLSQGMARTVATALFLILAFFTLTSIPALMLQRYYLLP